MIGFDKTEEIVRSFDRGSVGLICFIVCVVFYWAGVLTALTSTLPSIYYLLVIVALSGVLRLLVEICLGTKKLPSSGKAVFITGCDSGFGNRLAKRLVNQGYFVFAGCLDETCDGANSLRGYSESITTLQLNVTQEQSLKATEAEIRAKLESHNLQLWAVVANAGVIHGTPLELSSMTEIEQLINVNLLGVIRTVKTFLPCVRKCKGRIIVTSSLSASFALPYLVTYSTSKAAVKSFVQGLHRELRRFGVSCISIEPTFYRTPLLNMDGFTPAARLSKVDGEIKRNYSYFIDEYDSLMKAVYSIADTNIEVPIKAFEHAICSARPQQSYILAPLHYRLLTFVSTHFDVCFTDLVIDALFSYWKPIRNCKQSI